MPRPLPAGLPGLPVAPPTPAADDGNNALAAAEPGQSYPGSPVPTTAASSSSALPIAAEASQSDGDVRCFQDIISALLADTTRVIVAEHERLLGLSSGVSGGWCPGKSCGDWRINFSGDGLQPGGPQAQGLTNTGALSAPPALSRASQDSPSRSPGKGKKRDHVSFSPQLSGKEDLASAAGEAANCDPSAGLIDGKSSFNRTLDLELVEVGNSCEENGEAGEDEVPETPINLRRQFSENSMHRRNNPLSIQTMESMGSRHSSRLQELAKAFEESLAKPDKASGSRSCLSRLRNRTQQAMLLDSTMSVAIILNTIAIGMSCDVGRDWKGWTIVDAMFAAIFLMEVLLKLRMYGFVEYFKGPERKWNWFELTLVLFALLELVMLWIMGAPAAGQQGANMSLFRVLRLFRIIRILRVTRLPFVADLMMMINGTLGGFRTLFCSLVLICLPLYTVALLLRETLGELADQGHGAEVFANLPFSFFTVFRCIVAAECTEMSGRPIFLSVVDRFGWGYGLIYSITMAFMTFGLFNVIVAIYVENVVAAAKDGARINRRIRLRDELYFASKTVEMVNVIWEMNHDWDSGAEGIAKPQNTQDLFTLTSGIKITPERFEDLVQNPRFNKILEDLDVADEDRVSLFQTLDSDLSGSLDFEELVDGISKLRGDARRSDIVELNFLLQGVRDEVRKSCGMILTQLNATNAGLFGSEDGEGLVHSEGSLTRSMSAGRVAGFGNAGNNGLNGDSLMKKDK